MYRAHFGFTIKPFQINADPRFLWLGEKHTEALSVLKYGVLENRGFLLLTGDVGTGKTTLLNALLEGLDENVLVARIPDPRLDLMDFINILAGTLGMKETFQSRGPFLVRFAEHLQRQHYLGKTVLLIIDEAQRLTFELLEEIRALSNLEKPHAKFLNVFFVGQDEFNDMLLDYRSRALRQRITLSYHLEPLNRKEVGEYIWHRQKVAGARKNLFSKRAMDLVFAFSEGFPRLINIICDHALLTAYAGDKTFVSDTIITECARDLEVRPSGRQLAKAGQPRPAPPPETRTKPEAEKLGSKRRRALAAALFLLFSLALAGYGAFLWLPDSAGLRNLLPDKLLAGEEAGEKAMPQEQTRKPPAPRAEPEKSRNTPPTRPNSPDAEPAAEAGTYPEAKTPAEAPEQKNQPRRSIARQNPQAAQTAQKPEEPGNKPDDTPPPKKPEADQAGLAPAEAPQVDADFVRASAESARAGAGTARARAEKTPINPSRQSHQKLVVYFLHDAYDLEPRSIETLDKAKQLLMKNPELKTRVLGYTDSLGDAQYNLRLSEIRADIVKSYLTGNGVEPEQITAEGLGSQNPMRSNQSREGRAQNRRVEIVFEYPSR